MVDEMVELIEGGHEVAPGHGRSGGRRARGRREPGGDPRRRRLAPPQHQGRAENAEPETLRRLDPPQHDHLRDRPGRHRQDLPRGRDGGRGADRTQSPADHPHPARGRGRRAARLPARRHPGQGRPLPAPALRRALRHARPRPRQRLLRAQRDRGGAARLHARPHPQRLLRDPRRGPEHHPRADEDVPHPARLRLAHGGHRRRHPDRPADRPALRPDGGPRHPRRGQGNLLHRVRRRGRRPPQTRPADRRRLRPSTSAGRPV